MVILLEMIKNLLKITLGVFVLSTWYLAIDATYATCTADPLTPGFVCADGESCDLAGGCTCDGNPIALGASCAFPPVGGQVWADGVLGSVAYQALCTDVDGTICIGGNPSIVFAQWQQCLSDNMFTIMTSNGSCSDPDGCICDGLPTAYNATCSAFPPTGWGGDTTPPILTAWAVSNTGTATPNFIFISTEAWTISFSWVCVSTTTTANVWSNTIAFNPLATGTYSTCQIRVTDGAWNASLRLSVPTFTLSYTGTGVPPSSTSGWGGGSSSRAKDDCTLSGSALPGANASGIDYSPSYYDKLCGLLTATWSTYSDELNTAYLRAYGYGITTMDTIQKAHIGGELIRAHLAKMISNFAMVLGWRTPNTSLACNFADIGDQDTELQWYIRTACQLGLMGINSDGTPNTQFNPDDVVDRAQFGTILSRVIRWEMYNGGNPWYVRHLNALKQAEIMTLISQPYKAEIRGYVMIMMRRTYEEWFLNN